MIIGIWLLFGLISAIVASNKGRGGCTWFVIGILLGPFGFILALVISPNTAAVERQAMRTGDLKRCPYCKEFVKRDAIKCRFCSERLD